MLKLVMKLFLASTCVVKSQNRSFTSLVEAKSEQMIFQNGFNSTSKAAPPVKLEPEPFLEEPELSQTGPTCWMPLVNN